METLTELGTLVEMVGRDVRTGRRRVLRWGMRSAPSLAYDGAGRLHIVYLGDVVRPTTRRESLEYRRTHWGQGGRGDVRDGGEAVGPFREVMIGESITYATKKGGDAKLVDYVHAWGEGARGRWTAPTVVEHVCQVCRPGCAVRGAVALSGGTYRVGVRGIVG